MRRLRQDLDWIVSAGLLLSVAVTALTGVIADLWDLNDFWYHTVAGYVMGGLAVAHVAFNWDRLVSYARFRIRRSDAGGAGATTAPVRRRAAEPVPEPQTSGTMLRRLALSRRGLLGMAIGGIGGLAVGRGLRQPPQISAGSDVGVCITSGASPG